MCSVLEIAGSPSARTSTVSMSTSTPVLLGKPWLLPVISDPGPWNRNGNTNPGRGPGAWNLPLGLLLHRSWRPRAPGARASRGQGSGTRASSVGWCRTCTLSAGAVATSSRAGPAGTLAWLQLGEALPGIRRRADRPRRNRRPLQRVPRLYEVPAQLPCNESGSRTPRPRPCVSLHGPVGIRWAPPLEDTPPLGAPAPLERAAKAGAGLFPPLEMSHAHTHTHTPPARSRGGQSCPLAPRPACVQPGPGGTVPFLIFVSQSGGSCTEPG